MPEKKYDFLIDSNIQCFVRFITEKGITIGFIVRLVAFINGSRFEIRKYDTAHGAPHIDVLNLKGKTLKKFGCHSIRLPML